MEGKMNCAVCGFEVPPAAKYAIENNLCPACGKQIMNENTLSLIKDIEKKIAVEVKLCEKTSKKLAMLLVTNYNVNFGGVVEHVDTIIKTEELLVEEQPVEQQVEQVKVAPPSQAQQAEKASVDDGIIKAADLIDEQERERIFAEAIAGRYTDVSFTDSVVEGSEESDDEDIAEFVAQGDLDPRDKAKITGNIFTEGSEIPVLEKIRLAKKARDSKQGGAFRRGQ
jgi:hypothetical protein